MLRTRTGTRPVMTHIGDEFTQPCFCNIEHSLACSTIFLIACLQQLQFSYYYHGHFSPPPCVFTAAHQVRSTSLRVAVHEMSHHSASTTHATMAVVGSRCVRASPVLVSSFLIWVPLFSFPASKQYVPCRLGRTNKCRPPWNIRPRGSS